MKFPPRSLCRQGLSHCTLRALGAVSHTPPLFRPDPDRGSCTRDGFGDKERGMRMWGAPLRGSQGVGRPQTAASGIGGAVSSLWTSALLSMWREGGQWISELCSSFMEP